MELAVDIGGTKIEVSIIYKGRVIKSIRRLTEASKGRKYVLNNIISTLKTLNGLSVVRIGVSIAGIVNNNGLLVRSHNLKCLEGLNIAKEIEKVLKKNVYQENDANCFLIAEHKQGVAKKHKNVIGLTIGTGIGAGIMINGILYKGVIGGAGEIGKTIIDDDKTFEELCAGPGIVQRYLKAGGRIDNPSSEKIFKSPEGTARHVIEETYHYLGKGIANLINTFNPELIVIGGGVSDSLSLRKLRFEIDKRTIPILIKTVKIARSKIGTNACVIGASFLRN